MANALAVAHQILSRQLSSRTAPLGVNSCFVDQAREKLCVGLDAEASKSATAVRQELSLALGVDVEVACASMKRHACPSKTAECSPVWGGIQMEGRSNSAGTICLVTVDGDGNIGFLVSSHVVGEGRGTPIGQPNTAIRRIGTVTINPLLLGRQSDSAFATRSTHRIEVEQNAIWAAPDEAYSVVAFETSNNTPVDTPVAMQGATQEGLAQGQIAVLDVTTAVGTETLTGQVLATYNSQDGDSGAPVFSDPGDGSSVTFYGINVGLYTYDGTEYGWYSPTEGIRNDLGIPLA